MQCAVVYAKKLIEYLNWSFELNLSMSVPCKFSFAKTAFTYTFFHCTVILIPDWSGNNIIISSWIAALMVDTFGTTFFKVIY